MKLIWFVPSALAVIGQARGILATRGATLDSTLTRSSDQQYEALLDGSADAAVTSIDNVFDWNRRGAADDFRVAAQIETTTPLSLFTQPGITKIEELRGKTILVDAPNNGFAVALRMMLHEDGLEREDYHLDPAGGVRERFDGLRERRGDATLLGPPFDGMAIEAGFTLLGKVGDRYPAFPGQGLVFRQSTPATQELRGFIECMEAARVWMLIHRDEAAKLLMASGFPEKAARLMAAACPPALVPDQEGIALLIAHRRSLRLAGGEDTYDGLVDLRLTAGSKAGDSL